MKKKKDLKKFYNSLIYHSGLSCSPPPSGACKNTPCFRCRFHWDSENRQSLIVSIEQHPVQSGCTLQCCTWPPDRLRALLLTTPHIVFSSYLVHSGNYGAHLISPSELKITPMCFEPEKKKTYKLLVILEI